MSPGGYSFVDVQQTNIWGSKNKEKTMNQRRHKAHFLAAIFGLLFFISQVNSALAQNYTFNSLGEVNSTTPPSINNLGKVAYIRRVFDQVQSRNESVVMIHDGTSETAFFNLDDAGFFGQSYTVINDNGALAAVVLNGGTCPNNHLNCLIRINPNQTFTVLATANGVGGGGDFAEFQNFFSMNNAGQVAVAVRRTSDGANQIVRIDGAGVFTVIVTITATFLLSLPV